MKKSELLKRNVQPNTLPCFLFLKNVILAMEQKLKENLSLHFTDVDVSKFELV